MAHSKKTKKVNGIPLPGMEEEYLVVKVVPGPMTYNGITYNLAKLAKSDAERLSEDPGFKYLKKA